MTGFFDPASRVCATLFAMCLLVSCADISVERTFVDYANATQSGDWVSVYRSLTDDSAARVDSLVLDAINASPRLSHLEEKSPAERFAGVVDNTDHIFRLFDYSGYELIDAIAEGDRATVTIRTSIDRTREVVLVRLYREDGAWKVSL